MVDNIDANAYKEVLAVISHLVKEDYDKIPKEYIEYMEENCNKDYDFEYDNSKSLDEQILLKKTRYILFGLFEKFGATDSQKEMISNFKSNYNASLEEQKRKKYNPDDLFKTSTKPSKELDVINKKKIWYKKFFEKIVALFEKWV